MGLDITAYRQLSKNDKPELNEYGYAEDCFFVYKSMYEFSQQFGQCQPAGLLPETHYDYQTSIGFRAGSYSGYGAWRDWLAKVAGYESAKSVWDNPPPEGPFVELINFADNEGVIGPIASAKLAMDFAAFREAAEKHSDGLWYFEAYCKWQEAFEMAADNGAVDFH